MMEDSTGRSGRMVPTITGLPIFPPLYLGEPRFAILGLCTVLGVIADKLGPPVSFRARSARLLPAKASTFWGSSLNKAL